MPSSRAVDGGNQVVSELPGITRLNTHLAERVRKEQFESLLLFDVDQFHQLNQELVSKWEIGFWRLWRSC